jgi:hypothetical protein
MAIDIRRRMSGQNRRGDLRNLVRSRAVPKLEKKTGRIVHAVTIKGIDKADGVTIWEYGPGSFWRQHYGADAITGLVPDLAATLDKYAIAAEGYPVFAPCGNRNAGSLEANVVEAMSLVKLNSLDGTVIEQSVITGFFCSEITEFSAVVGLGITVTNAAALSGGDFVIVGQRLPIIEFVDFASNGATKEYILHAHGQQAGNVYLKTRTSSETITIPRNATAGEVETLFEGTSDCVSATATGGPWPLNPIEIEVVWSVSSGDISGIAATPTYAVYGTGTVYTWNTTFNGGDLSYTETITVTSVTIGSEWSFQFMGGGGLGVSSTFTYTAATTDVSAFVTALKAALSAYQAANSGEANWGYVVLIDNSSNILTIEYSQEARLMNLSVDSAGAEDARRAGSCAAAYDTGTGAITSAVGFDFGYAEGRIPSKMFVEVDAIPGVTGLNVLGILAIGSGPSNSVVITPNGRNNGDAIKENVVEKWDIAGGAWAFDWQVYCNAIMLMPPIIQCESGYIICPIGGKRFGDPFTGDDRTAAKIAVSDGSITEVMTTYGTLRVPDNWQNTAMYDDDPTKYLTWGYEVTYFSSINGRPLATYNPRGADTYVNGDELRIGAFAFAADDSAVYAKTSYSVSGNWYYDASGSSSDHEALFRFITPWNTRSAEPQQFRFKFEKIPGVNYTAWLDWYATATEIETALNDLLGAGNVSFIDFGLDPTPVENDPVALIEFNPLFRFYTDAGYTPGSGFIPKHYFDYRNDGVLIGGVVIEMQTITPFTSPAGIAAYNITNATKLWSRPFGTIGGIAASDPQYAWLQGDFVYAYGAIVDSEL